MVEKLISIIVVSGKTRMGQKKGYQKEKSNNEFLRMPRYKS